MKISLNNVRELITALGFLPEDGRDNIYYKKYSGHDGYIVRVNFNTEKIEYREDSIDDAHGITWAIQPQAILKTPKTLLFLNV